MDKLSFTLILCLFAYALGRYVARYRYAERHHYDAKAPVYTKVDGRKVILYRYPALRKV